MIRDPCFVFMEIIFSTKERIKYPRYLSITVSEHKASNQILFDV